MVLNKNSSTKNAVKSRSFSSGFGRPEYGGESSQGQSLVRASRREAPMPSESRFVRTASGGGDRLQHSTSTNNYGGPAGVGASRNYRAAVRHGSPGHGGGSSSSTPFVVSPNRHSMSYPYTGPSGSGGVLNTSKGSAGASAAAPFKAGGALKPDAAATKPSTHRNSHPDPMVNDYENDMATYEYEEPYNQRGGSVADSVVHREHHSSSRHQSDYPWPAMTEPARSFRPSAVSHSPIHHGENAYSDADMYQSEYAVRCAELKAKQRELMAKSAASQAANRERAGVKSVARQALDRVAGAAPAVIPYNVGLSESKMKFTWKQGEPAVPVAPAADKLNLFRTADGDLDALRTDRELSVAKQDYVLHAAQDIMRGIQERSENQNNSNLKASMSLAWDDAQASEEQQQQSGHKALNRSTRDKYAPGQPVSEYTRKYTWKEGESPAASPARPKTAPAAASQLNLFAGKTDLSVSSEYNRHFVNHELDSVNYQPQPIAGMVNKSEGAYPSHFAWAAGATAAVDQEDGDDDDLNASRRRHLNVLNNPNVLSEYHRKYMWHDPQPRTQPVKPTPSAAASGDLDATAEGSILGLDRHALQTSEWRTEYDDTFQRAALDASRGVYLSPVAGVSTRQRDAYPVNYAWKDEPAPAPVMPSPKRRPPAELPMTEYEAKFYEMPLVEVERPKPKKIAEGERLNLFDEAPTSQQQQNNLRLKSEYAASFRAFDAADRVKPIKGRLSENPAQFAWSVIDGEAPKPVHVRKTPAGPVETSEYNAKYQWLQAAAGAGSASMPPPAGIVSNVQPGVSTENPIADAPTSVSEWASEARSAIQARNAANFNSIPPAGMKTSTHGEIPTFYAWEPEVKPVVHKPVRFPGEVVHSEYEDRFKAWTAVPRASITAPAAVSSDTQLDLFGERKPFVESTEHRDNFKDVHSTTTMAVAAPVAGRAKAPQEELPTQFAWSLVDGERMKEPPRRPVNPNAVQLSEYETKYRWPETVEKPVVVKKTSATADHAIFPSEESSKEWQSEADAHFTTRSSSDPSTAVSAGVRSEKPPAAPSFYAWPEVPPSEAPPRPQYQWEPVKSEYGEKFTSASKVEARIEPVKLHPDTLNLFEPKQPFSQEKSSGVSEYDDKFRNAASAAAAAAAPVLPHVDLTPHQFAWPLVDGERKKEPVQYSSDHPFYGITEHDAQYNWPSTKDTLACKTLIKPSALTGNKSSPTIILPGANAGAASVLSQSQSEYDARCAILKNKQRAVTEAAKALEEVPPAGVPTIRPQHTPSFYAWQKPDKKPETPVVVSRSNAGTLNAQSEYDAQYKWKGAKGGHKPAEMPDASLIKSLAMTKDSLETSNRLNPNGLPFEGVSEYDDQFASAARTASVINHHQHPAAHAHEKSLRGTNIEQGVEDASYGKTVLVSAPKVNNADMPVAGLSTESLHADHINAAAAGAAPRPQSVHVCSGAAGSYSTETSDKFVNWKKQQQQQHEPQHIAARAAAAGNDVHLKQKQCSACYTDKENVHSNSLMALSESRDQFSWPVRRKVTSTTTGVSHNAPRKVSPGRRVYYSNGKPLSSEQQQAETASVHSSGTSTVTTVPSAAQQQQQMTIEDSSSNRAVQPTTTTTLESHSSNSSTVGTSTKKTPTDTQMSVASSGCGASSSTITSTANAESAAAARSGPRNAAYIDFQKKNRLNAAAGIPGLRYPLDSYRSRSAPPRRLMSQSFTDNRYKAKMFVDQDTTSNPVLIHKRYPHNSDRQIGRWTTETGDKFNWKRASSPSAAVNTSLTH